MQRDGDLFILYYNYLNKTCVKVNDCTKILFNKNQCKTFVSIMEILTGVTTISLFTFYKDSYRIYVYYA